jgi:hypothetical protein
MPRGDMEDSEAIRRREMLASMGLPSGMEVDSTSIAPAPRAVADDLEMGSSPMFSMHPVDTPARLRGGGGSSAAQALGCVDGRWASAGAQRLGRLTLRGGGNVLSLGSKYTAKEVALNKQLCGAVKRGCSLFLPPCLCVYACLSWVRSAA